MCRVAEWFPSSVPWKVGTWAPQVSTCGALLPSMLSPMTFLLLPGPRASVNEWRVEHSFQKRVRL